MAKLPEITISLKDVDVIMELLDGLANYMAIYQDTKEAEILRGFIPDDILREIDRKIAAGPIQEKG